MRRKITLLLLASGLSLGLFAQNRVIVGEKREPKKDARLEAVNPNNDNPGGIQLPFVSLVATDKPDPLTAGGNTCEHLKGMTVYNTATAGTGATAVTPGLYYNDGEKWTRVGDVNPEQLQGLFWGLKGNAGTDPSLNFIGTTDDKDLIFKRNGIQAGRIAASNLHIGIKAGASNGGANNIALGSNALASNNAGNINIAIGQNALTKSTSGSNLAIGSDALRNQTTGLNNMAIGVFALNKVIDGRFNIALGNNALSNMTKGDNNLAIGHSAATKTTGVSNTVVGTDALAANTTGTGNAVFGYMAANGEDSANPITEFGVNNTAIGTQAMQLGSGNGNTMIGTTTGSRVKGNNNIAVGNNAMNNTVEGSKNIVIGAYDTQSNTFQALTKNAENNILIGYGQNLLKTSGEEGGSNQLNIGGAIFGREMKGSVDAPAGKIGILEATASENLHVKGTTRVTELPKNGQANAIHTNPDGTPSNNKDQTFTPINTVVADKNGVLGIVEGIASTTPPEVQPVLSKLKHVTFNSKLLMGIGAQSEAEVQRVMKESLVRLGCLEAYFRPKELLHVADASRGRLYVGLALDNGEGGLTQTEDLLIFTGSRHTEGGSFPVRATAENVSISSEATHITTIDYNSEEVAYVDVMMPKNGQVFRISLTGTAKSAIGDPEAQVLLGVVRMH